MKERPHSAVERRLVLVGRLGRPVGGAVSERSRGAVAADGLQTYRPLHLPRRRVGARRARLHETRTVCCNQYLSGDQDDGTLQQDSFSSKGWRFKSGLHMPEVSLGETLNPKLLPIMNFYSVQGSCSPLETRCCSSTSNKQLHHHTEGKQI